MLYGKRIRLRGNERSDLPKFVEWLNDPEVRRFLSMSLPISQATEEQVVREHAQAPARGTTSRQLKSKTGKAGV